MTTMFRNHPDGCLEKAFFQVMSDRVRITSGWVGGRESHKDILFSECTEGITCRFNKLINEKYESGFREQLLNQDALAKAGETFKNLRQEKEAAKARAKIDQALERAFEKAGAPAPVWF